MVRGGESHCGCTASLTPWGEIPQTGEIPKSSLTELLTGGTKQLVQTQIWPGAARIRVMSADFGAAVGAFAHT